MSQQVMPSKTLHVVSTTVTNDVDDDQIEEQHGASFLTQRVGI